MATVALTALRLLLPLAGIRATPLATYTPQFDQTCPPSGVLELLDHFPWDRHRHRPATAEPRLLQVLTVIRGCMSDFVKGDLTSDVFAPLTQAKANYEWLKELERAGPNSWDFVRSAQGGSVPGEGHVLRVLYDVQGSFDRVGACQEVKEGEMHACMEALAQLGPHGRTAAEPVLLTERRGQAFTEADLHELSNAVAGGRIAAARNATLTWLESWGAGVHWISKAAHPSLIVQRYETIAGMEGQELQWTYYTINRTLVPAPALRLEVETLSLALRDMVCFKAYFRCYKALVQRMPEAPVRSDAGLDRLETGAQGKPATTDKVGIRQLWPGWAELVDANRNLRRACEVVDFIFAGQFAQFFRSSGALAGEDIEDYSSLDLNCGGYFLHADWLRYFLQEYKFRKFPELRRRQVPSNDEDGIMKVLRRIRMLQTTSSIDTASQSTAATPRARFPPLSSYVVNIGAGAIFPDSPLHCVEDPADCLCSSESYRCILFEGDPQRSRRLVEQYARPLSTNSTSAAATEARDVPQTTRVRIMEGYATPEEVVKHTVAAAGEISSVAAGEQRFFPDLLKIDVDNGDCEFLETFLKVFTPVTIHMCITHSILPPSVAYSRYFEDGAVGVSVMHQYETKSVLATKLRSCSLGEVIRISKAKGYQLFNIDVQDGNNAHFIHNRFIQGLPREYLLSEFPSQDPASVKLQDPTEMWRATMMDESRISFDETVILGYTGYPFRRRILELVDEGDQAGLLELLGKHFFLANLLSYGNSYLEEISRYEAELASGGRHFSAREIRRQSDFAAEGISTVNAKWHLVGVST